MFPVGTELFHADRRADGHTEKQTDRVGTELFHADRRTYRQTNRQTADRQTKGQMDLQQGITKLIRVTLAILLGLVIRDQLSYPRWDSKAQSQ